MRHIFIGWDRRFPDPAKVLAHSIVSHSDCQNLSISFLHLQCLKECYGVSLPEDKLASTEFTYSRFLVPFLTGYKGMALFLDNDMLCVSDINQLFDWFEAKPHLSLGVRKHSHCPQTAEKMYGAAQTQYPRKNWSSMMLMRCDQLRCWTPQVVAEGNGARLHRFQDVPDSCIGGVGSGWNDLEYQMNADTKLFHWTEGGPWFDKYHGCPFADVWLRWRKKLAEAGDIVSLTSGR